MRNPLAHRRRAPGAGFLKTAFWDAGSLLCQSVVSWQYHFRVEGASNIPSTGPAIFIANHQSLFDPVIHGLAVGDRAPRPMAKQELFKNPLFGAILRGLNCICVRSDGGNREAIRVALDELAAGRTVMLYPEGTRSSDGAVKEFRRGVELLARKSRAPIVPMGIDGAFDIWPTGQSLPRSYGRIWAAVGEAISPEAQVELFADPAVGLAHLQQRVTGLMQHCRAQLRRATAGAYPAHGAADDHS